MTNKLRIAMAVSSPVHVRNFINSGALDDLRSNHELTFIAPSRFKGLPDPSRVTPIDMRISHSRRERYLNLSMIRYARRSRTFPIKSANRSNGRSFLRKLAAWLLTRPVVYETFSFFAERSIPVPASIKTSLLEIRPDLVLYPSGLNDGFATDITKACRELNITSVMMMANWDNVSCKGVLKIQPDYLTVWGEQTREQAVRIHRMPGDRVKILGSPQFEVYTRALSNRSKSHDIRDKLGLQNNDILLLFIGIARYRDEIALLQQIEEHIAGMPGTVKLHVIYRPHPWQDDDMRRSDFFSRTWRHITMDPQIADAYRSARTGSANSSAIKAFAPDYDYYPGLIGSCQAVMTSLGTMGIEAMIMGKPLLLMTFPDKKHAFSVDTIKAYDHHQCWRAFRHVIDCSTERELLGAISAISEWKPSARVIEEIMEDAQNVVFTDKNTTFSSRLRDYIESIALPCNRRVRA